MHFFIAQMVGVVGIVVFLLSFQCKDSQHMIFLTFCANICVLTQFLLLHAYTGCLTTVLALFSGLLQCFYGRPWASWSGWKWIFTDLNILASFITWDTALSLLPCVAGVATTLAYWSRDGKLIRTCRLLVIAPSLILYDVCVQAFFAAAGQFLSIISILIFILRHRTEMDRVRALGKNWVSFGSIRNHFPCTFNHHT